MNMQRHDIRHVVSDAPRVMVVDGSKLVRKLIGDVLAKSLPGATVTQAGSVVAARALLGEGGIDLVTTSLALPDGDGIAVAEAVRESAGQAYVPVIVVSGEAQARLGILRRVQQQLTQGRDLRRIRTHTLTRKKPSQQIVPTRQGQDRQLLEG